MQKVFENDTISVVVNPGTNEVHITAKQTTKSTSLGSSLRIGVDSKGFDLTTSFSEYIPKSFNGLPGFRIVPK